MNTALECMPCFMKMAVRDAALACPDDEQLQYEIIMAWGQKLTELDLSSPPPAIARHLSNLIKEKTGVTDLYAQDKLDANAHIAELLPQLEAKVEDARVNGGDPLALVLELAIIGNYIDRGVELEVDLEGELANVAGSIDKATLEEFRTRIQRGADVLILGDNTGEIVLDTLLVKELQRFGCNVTYTVRSKPILNDATMEDAEAVGMTKLCTVVESGVDTPGTILELCTPEFLDLMRSSEVILSKGQGNFEALEDRWPDIFCGFKVKCKRVAADAGLPFGTSAFRKTTPPTQG